MKFSQKAMIAAFAVLPFTLFAQVRPGGDTTGRGASPQRSVGPRPYNEVITARAKTDRGLFTVHNVDDNYFLEIPDGLLGTDILVVNRISKSAADVRSGFAGYAGDQIGENVIRFERGPNNKIFLKSISFRERASDSAGMYKSVLNSTLQPIAASFDIRAFARDSVSGRRGSVIDITSYLNSDNDILFFEASSKRTFGLGQQQADRSYISSVRAYPNNVEIKTVKTYLRTPPTTGFGGGGGAAAFGQASATPVTYELNSSMILLPKNAMQPRYFDPRVGFFATGYTDFDANPQGVKRISMITRWRLEPKPEDVEKYKRGELVEPAKQIVYYIDPATPRKWIPYLIAGVNDWNVAFEKAGWKNAIVAKEAPVNDPNWSLEGAGYSAIVYKPSDVPNASGPNVNDPRTGEILESHINWYHNVMSLVRNWYFIQAAPVDPSARKMVFDDELMGQLIRFVSSHEVGHTLGLRHNYGSSSTVPVEKLRDKAWVEANGHTPSIMDYARFNYVAQPEDNISQKGLFPRIGDYDKWAIEWGYRWFPQFKSAEAERPFLNQWTIKNLENKRLWFGTETDPDDPRGQNEDLSDNAMIASGYGIKNLKRIIPNIIDWTKEANEGYTNAKTIYDNVTSQFNRYMGHVSKNIGGKMTTPRTVEEQGVIYEPVSEAKQKEAMQFLQEQLFKTPTWLLDKKLYAVAGTGDMTTISTLQQSTLNRVLSASTIEKLLQQEAMDPVRAYTASEMLNDLKSGIFSELAARSATDIYRRNLQKIYVERLIDLIKPAAPATATTAAANPFSQNRVTTLSKNSDALSIVKGHMRSLASQARSAQASIADNATKLHLQDIADRLSQALKANSGSEE
jgi:hypothetical protein